MSMLYKLTRIFYKEMFSNGDFFENVKSGKKKIGKIIGYSILLLYLVVVFGFMYFTLINSTHLTFSSLGMKSGTLILIGFFAFFVTFMFGFTGSIGTYITNKDEEIFFSFPLKVSQIFSAKFLCTYISQLLFGAVVIIGGLGIYGYHEKLLTNPLFILEGLLAALSIPLISVGVCYLILVTLLGCFKFLRKKQILSAISTIFILVFFFGFYFMWMSNTGDNFDPTAILTGAALDNMINIVDFVKFFPPIHWFAKAIELCLQGEYLKSFGFSFLLTAIAVAIPFIILPLLSPLYKRSLEGFGETKIKKLKKEETSEYIKEDIKSTPILLALFKRDVKGVVRETSWFANGPLTMIICPLIFVISCFGLSKAGGSLLELQNEIFNMIEMIKTSDTTLFNTIIFWLSFICGLISVLIGSMSSIATTAISREGKGLQNILAMPFSLKTFLNAKMLHAMFYSVIATVFVTILLAVMAILFSMPFTPGIYIMLFVNFIWFSLVTQFIINMIDMLIDVCHPKLSWENPIAVFKQNLISTVAIFLSWGIIALFVILAIYVIPTSPLSLLLMNIVLTAIAISLWILFLNFAKKKLENLY